MISSFRAALDTGDLISLLMLFLLSPVFPCLLRRDEDVAEEDDRGECEEENGEPKSSANACAIAASVAAVSGSCSCVATSSSNATVAGGAGDEGEKDPSSIPEVDKGEADGCCVDTL